jgi:glycosyltransferase involved in cell wall biosynthesis
MQRLARGLRAIGHDVLIVAPRASGDGLPLRGHDAFGTPYVSFELPRKPRYLPYYVHFAAALRTRMRAAVKAVLGESRWDAAILEGESGWAFEPVREICQWAGVLALPYPVEWFAPSVANVLGLSWFDHWYSRKTLHRRSDGLIGITRLWSDYATRIGKPSVVVPAFSKFADGDLPPVIQTQNERFRIGFVGRWVKRELPVTLFKALAILTERRIDWEMIVVGSARKPTSLSHRLGERPAAKALSRMPDVAARIHFRGFVPEDQLQREMGSVDAFALLREQNRETAALFPTRLPEILATGKPVVVSNAGDLAFHLTDRQNALVIPPGDHPAELADALAFLATNPDQARAIGLGGRKALAESFSQVVLASRIDAFLRGQLARTEAAPACT